MITQFVNHLLDGEQTTDQGVALKFDAELFQVVDLGVDHIIGQAEIGDAVFQNTTGLVEGLVDRDVAAGLGHVSSAGHTGWPRSHDANTEAVRFDVRDVDPALPDCGVTDKAFKPPDCHCFERLADGADAFALIFLWADASADGRQQAGLGQDVVGTAQILLADLLDEARDVDADRATRDAGLVRAHQAAIGFAQGFFEVVAAGHFFKIPGPNFRVLLAHGCAILWNGSNCFLLCHLLIL